MSGGANRVLGVGGVSACVLGGSGFICGFWGPMLFSPGANQGPLLGIFFTGPIGFVLGLVLGLIVGFVSEHFEMFRLRQLWFMLLWFCAIASFSFMAYAEIQIPVQRSKTSIIIDNRLDIDERQADLATICSRSIGDDDIPSLAKFQNADDIDLSWNDRITDVGVERIVALRLPVLSQIMLMKCPQITDRSLAALSPMKTLTYLSVAGCERITDAGLACIAGSATLTTLDLRGCIGISDAGLRSLSRTRSLRYVHLGGCTNITSAGMSDLQKALSECCVKKDDREWELSGQ